MGQCIVRLQNRNIGIRKIAKEIPRCLVLEDLNQDRYIYIYTLLNIETATPRDHRMDRHVNDMQMMIKMETKYAKHLDFFSLEYERHTQESLHLRALAAIDEGSEECYAALNALGQIVKMGCWPLPVQLLTIVSKMCWMGESRDATGHGSPYRPRGCSQ